MILLILWQTNLKQFRMRQRTLQKRLSKKRDLIPIKQEIHPGLVNQQNDCQRKPFARPASKGAGFLFHSDKGIKEISSFLQNPSIPLLLRNLSFPQSTGKEN